MFAILLSMFSVYLIGFYRFVNSLFHPEIEENYLHEE